MPLARENRDHVTPPVIVGAGAGVLIAALVKTYLDVQVDPADATLWWEWFTAVAVPLFPAVGAFLGGLRAKKDVTPVTADATPRDLAGDRLVKAGRTETTGYSPTRAATPEERLPPRQPRRPFEAP